MGDVIMLGFTDVLLPLIGWITLFFFGTLTAGIVVTVWSRGRLQRGKKPTGIATAFMVIVLCLALPVFAVYMSFSFALQRGVGHLLEKGGRSIVEWTLEVGGDAFEHAMEISGEDTLVDLVDLRKRFEEKKKPLATLPEAEAGSPLGMVVVLPAFVEAMFWESLRIAVEDLDEEEQNIQWKDLRARAEKELVNQGEIGFKEAGSRFHEGARKSLYTALGVILVPNLLAILLCVLIAGFKKEEEPAAPGI